MDSNIQVWRFREAVVPNRKTSVYPSGCGSAFFWGEDLWLLSGFLRGWECTSFSGNNQMADDPCLSPKLLWLSRLVAQNTTSSRMPGMDLEARASS